MSSMKNISFEVTDNWDIEGFRNFVKFLLSDERFNVLIISNDNSTSYVSSIGALLGMDEDNVVICNFTNDKIQAVQDNDIHIHLDNLQSFVLLVEETTDAYGILVNPNLNRHYLKPDYVLVFERLLKQLSSEES